VVGVAHRLPTELRVPLSTAASLAAAGVPVVIVEGALTTGPVGDPAPVTRGVPEGEGNAVVECSRAGS
jgi:hypothetical protein